MPRLAISTAALALFLGNSALANPLNFAKPYAGVMLGWQGADADWSTGNGEGSGPTLGVTAGLNILTYDIPTVLNQLGPVYLVGLDVALDAAGDEITGPCPEGCTAEFGLRSTVALRGGVAWDKSLLYGKIGYSSASYDLTLRQNGATYSDDVRIGGVMLGIGGEFALMENILGRVEMNFTPKNSDDYTLGAESGEIEINNTSFKGGFLYQF